MSEPRPSQDPEISVVVCTRNRAEPLREFLTSFMALRQPEGLTWELVIVDNGSSDGTGEVVAEFTTRLPIRLVREEEPGLANARNAGVRAARGRYICWTDDDVALDPEWLAAYAQAFRRHPEAAVFGGRILPVLQGPTPPWITRLAHLWPVTDILAAREFGDRDVPIDFEKGQIPWGANFAIRTEEQRRVAYDPQLGVSPNQRRSGEETQLMFELMRDGTVTGWMVPEPLVHHLYPARRQTRSYFYEHYYAIGETWAYLQHSRGVHYMNRSGSPEAELAAPAALLQIRALLHRVAYAGFHILGMTRRSLYSLRKAAMYSGSASYQRANKGGDQTGG